MSCKSAVFLLICGLFTVSCMAEDFNPRRTHLLDTAVAGNHTNLLFRGNNPIVNHQFAFDQVVATLRSVLQNATGGRIPFPPDFYLIDVSFLVGLDPKESGDLSTEKAFFKSNSSVGQLINWPLLGNLGNPDSFPKSLREDMAKNLDKWTTDKMGEKVPELRAMFLKPMDKPVIVYIHCEAGVDRTGAMSGNYMMTYHNQTYAQVLAFDDSVEPRPIAKASEHSLMWYCLYLHWAEGRDYMNCPHE